MSVKHDTAGFLVGAPIGTETLRGVLADTLGITMVFESYPELFLM